MDLCLTARMMDAAEAEKSGLVARVIPAEQLLDETLKAAQTIAGYSLPVVMMIKESVNRAFESSLNEGLLFERASSTPPSRSRTRRKAWPPSSRSASPTSRIAEAAMYQTLEIERAGKVATIWMNRPAVFNAPFDEQLIAG